MKKKTGKYILLGIVGIIIVLVAVNWGEIKLLVNMMICQPFFGQFFTEQFISIPVNLFAIIRLFI